LREHRDEFRHVDAHVALVCQSGSRAALAAGAIVLTSVLTSLALPAASAVAGVVDVGLVVAALTDSAHKRLLRRTAGLSTSQSDGITSRTRKSSAV
jgi:hypothetical protein